MDGHGWLGTVGPLVTMGAVLVLFSTLLGRLAMWIGEGDAERPELSRGGRTVMEPPARKAA